MEWAKLLQQAIEYMELHLAFFPPLVIKIILEGGKIMDYRIVETEKK